MFKNYKKLEQQIKSVGGNMGHVLKELGVTLARVGVIKADMKIIKDRLAALEEYLGVEYKEEINVFKGYKKIKK